MAEMITDFVMEAEVTERVGAGPHERSDERVTHRNGHRELRWDTCFGTLRLQVPKLREGGYVPSFIELRNRSEQALISMIQEAVVEGRVQAQDRSGTGAVWDRRRVGRASELFVRGTGRQGAPVPRTRTGRIALRVRGCAVRESAADDRLESMAVVIATGVNREGRREVLGFDVIAAESEEGWTGFFKSLRTRSQWRAVGDCRCA